MGAEGRGRVDPFPPHIHTHTHKHTHTHTHTHAHTPRHAPASMSGTHFGFLDRVTTEAIADYL